MSSTSKDPREQHWHEVWERLGVFRAKDDGSAERRFVLTMFPYPSGDLHMGHAEVFAIEDAIARFWRLRGFDVMNPIGWDSFGLPAENAAIRSGRSPREYTEENISQQAATARRYAVSFDWSRRFHTHEPAYYRWTQWLFCRMLERGLAYRAPADVNWCPRDQTVLANEQVLEGRCERCGSEVEQRELVQWFFRTTAYAERLLEDMERLEDSWPSSILAMQRHWIGRSEDGSLRLRDWLVSRQRYWGAPIPVVHCPTCGAVPVPDDELPVELPELRGDELLPRGTSPLAHAREWVQTHCPRCGAPAERDTDTMDTFVDSSWYFVRYCSPDFEGGPVDPEAARRWLPAAVYVGGAEHAILHLLYSRFVTKVLFDLGVIEVDEPFASLVNQGQVINEGKAMSKSLGNGVELGEQLDTHGVDAVRLAIIFSGPPEADLDWADVHPEAMRRFLDRALRIAEDVGAAGRGSRAEDGEPETRRAVHRRLAEITALVEERRLNVAVARLMDLVGLARHAIDAGPGAQDPAVREAAEAAAVVLSLFAPYAAEEMWERLGHEPSVALAGWPQVDESLLALESVVAVVQVDGRLRDRLEVPAQVSQEELTQRARASEAVQRALGDREVVRVVVRAPRLVNLVTRSR